mmetsp:Transcript_10642/g.22532  ORF Transcript_10642/g.22532 Transcript_10642/m.22532 type:complete len:98 (+) Transcript_10642:1246-1539(+)
MAKNQSREHTEIEQISYPLSSYNLVYIGNNIQYPFGFHSNNINIMRALFSSDKRLFVMVETAHRQKGTHDGFCRKFRYGIATKGSLCICFACLFPFA